MTARVAVTGLGAVCALGHDAPTTWAALLAGRSGVGPIVNISTDRLQLRVAAEVRGFEAEAHLDPRRLVMMDRASQMVVVAAREALRDAGLSPDPAQARRRGVVLGATIGQAALDEAYEVFYGAASNRIHPLTVPRVMPNAPASQVSMEFGLRGPCFATASACASANHAIGQALAMLRSDLADVVVSGGDATALHRDLLPSSRARGARRQLAAATPSLSGFVLLLALRGRTPGLAHHTVAFPADYDAEFDAVFGTGACAGRPRPVADPRRLRDRRDRTLPAMTVPSGPARRRRSWWRSTTSSSRWRSSTSCARTSRRRASWRGRATSATCSSCRTGASSTSNASCSSRRCAARARCWG